MLATCSCPVSLTAYSIATVTIKQLPGRAAVASAQLDLVDAGRKGKGGEERATKKEGGRVRQERKPAARITRERQEKKTLSCTVKN